MATPRRPRGRPWRPGHAPASGAYNLPIGLTRFVGRSPELREIDALLTSCRLVTLTGTGGVGKTRLALEAAAAVIDRYRDGVWLIELAALQRGEEIAVALAEALGVTANGGQSSLELLQLVWTHLADRQALFVFDNCEHLVSAVAPIVQSLLMSCAGVAVLATSRESLGVPGEVTLTVPPMPLPPTSTTDTEVLLAYDTVTLFCARAVGAQPRFELTTTNAGDVSRLCRRLEGIPLAIELAAARVRLLSVGQIARLLEESFRFLGDGPRTAQPRHRTLQATLDWSHDLLSPPEQVALRRLAVFPDRFDLDAAAAVINWEPSGARAALDDHGLELVAQLVDKSLVVVEHRADEPRYRLVQPLREYAADKLEAAGETAAARDHHRDHFLAHATMWSSEIRGLTRDRRLYADRRNYLTALEWSWSRHDVAAALALVVLQGGVWLRSSDPTGREWVERVLGAPEPADHWARAEALAVLAEMIHDSDHPQQRLERHLLDDVAAMARRVGDDAALAYIEVASAELELATGDTTAAVGTGRGRARHLRTPRLHGQHRMVPRAPRMGRHRRRRPSDGSRPLRTSRRTRPDQRRRLAGLARARCARPVDRRAR